jgi:surface antigen
MNTKVISFFAIFSLVLVACEQNPTKQTTGAVLGGIAGGALGSQVGGGRGRDIAMIAGTILGAAIGGAVGASMDRTDVAQTQSVLESERDNQTVSWTNPNTNTQYEVIPTRTYQTSAGTYCREFSTTAVIDGERETVYGTACRQPDGSWQSIDN